jgi:hypothetical protein
MSSDNPHQDSLTALDEAARRAHAASLDHLSPRVQAQLAQRRRATLEQNDRSDLRMWPMLAWGSAAALTLVVGLFAMRGSDEARTPTTTVTAATQPTPAVDAPQGTAAATPIGADQNADETADATADIASIDAYDAVDRIVEDDILPSELLAAEFDSAEDAIGFDALEENPDFYLWLGSEEAQADVTESL